jgi:hypothetical protein
MCLTQSLAMTQSLTQCVLREIQMIVRMPV